MDIVLVPGLWLRGSSWDAVVPHLEEAGHTAHPLTLPGLESVDTDRSGITAQDQVDAVVAAIDATDGPVVLVGHSLGSSIAAMALDARVEKVAHVVYVGGWPGPEGKPLAGWADTDGADFPMPPLTDFDEADLRDVETESFVAAAIPSPASLKTDVAHYSDERRYAVPATAVCPEYTAAQLQEWIAEGEANVAELPKIQDLRYVDVPTGHWPQLTRPRELAEAILSATR